MRLAPRTALRQTIGRCFSLLKRRVPAPSIRLALQRTYFFTSERGLFGLDSQGWWQILKTPCYGIAIRGDRFFLSTYDRGHTSLVAGDRRALGRRLRAPDFHDLYRQRVHSSNSRVHGVFAGDTALWAANTNRNALLRLSYQNSVIEEIPLFFDSFGAPISHDHNHVNGVSEYGGVVLFTAYRAGGQSMIGLYDGSEVTGYAYPNVGVHDVLANRHGIFFCDTFGSDLEQGGGRVVGPNGALDESRFAEAPGFVVRGMAGDESELLIGHSHKGPRSKRFDGHGALLLMRDGRVEQVIPVPSAQVYQIITDAGDFLLPAPLRFDADTAHTQLRAMLGEPYYRVTSRPTRQAA